MADNFFDLYKDQQREIVEATSAKLSLSSSVIEKDFWICWVLEKLFELPLMMAFKGGTSLSKCYGLIQRFSEDLDITLDYHNLFPSIDLTSQSRSSLKKISEKLKKEVFEQVHNKIYPHLQNALREQKMSEDSKLELSENGEKLFFYYPSLSETSNSYLKNHILVEFGGRNSTKPNESRQVTTFISSVASNLKLPSPYVTVLSPLRTFWEKVTLIHVQCHRGRLISNPERLSRHWYDLAMLLSQRIHEDAMSDKSLFEDVMLHKMAFYNASYANYDKCFDGNFKLIPNGSEMDALRKDYTMMIDSGMFSTTPIAFNEIIKSIAKLQNKLNSF